MTRWNVRGYAYYHELVEAEVEADTEEEAWDKAYDALSHQEHEDRRRSRFWEPTLVSIDEIEVSESS